MTTTEVESAAGLLAVTPPIADGASTDGAATAPRRGIRISGIRARRGLTACAVSGLLHTTLVVALGILVAPRRSFDTPSGIVAATVVPPTKILVEPIRLERPVDPQPVAVVASAARFDAQPLAPSPPAPRMRTSRPTQLRAPTIVPDIATSPQLLVGFDPAEHKVRLGHIRSPAQRLQAVVYRGGTPQSEKAVDRALEWLARHQNADGSWSFDHRAGGDCQGRCRSPGTLIQAKAAATSMALLPFLAAGQTHKQGPYKKQIEAGLKFIVRNIQKTPHGGALTHGGGTMYSQALATITLCEALAMTRDKDLIAPAQSAVSYIINTQDPQGGGWRYFPGMPGDTSVTGWQLMALKSADNAYIPVPAKTIERMRAFFDYVQQDEGAAYGYVAPDAATTSSTPVGLLCRMTLGWKRDEPALVRGIDAISAGGPKPDNVYFNFYATQVLHHFGGPLWEKWNKSMREGLIAAQVKEGHEAGSWFVQETTLEDQQASLLGGRLYTTALAALTLEVYYRHLPLYGNRVTLDVE